jgi:hypothetical protein
VPSIRGADGALVNAELVDREGSLFGPDDGSAAEPFDLRQRGDGAPLSGTLRFIARGCVGGIVSFGPSSSRIRLE